MRWTTGQFNEKGIWLKSDHEGEFVSYDDHLAAVEEARRGAYSEALERWILDLSPNDKDFESWLRARAEGRPE